MQRESSERAPLCDTVQPTLSPRNYGFILLNSFPNIAVTNVVVTNVIADWIMLRGHFVLVNEPLHLSTAPALQGGGRGKCRTVTPENGVHIQSPVCGWV